ncbi:MAG: CNNM domain-containing protein [Planctomycetota bacterium]
MLLLIGLSAFFSASEAALFYLSWADRRQLAAGNHSQRVAARLLHDPDRLLSAVLFWNLVVNILYFTLGSIVSVRLERHEDMTPGGVAVFATGSLLTIIFFSEMMPKTFAVLRSRWLAGVVSIPLAAAVAAVDPFMPLLRGINLFSRRLLWPGFASEAALEFGDLERAIEVSSEDSELAAQEHTVLRNIVNLSDLQVREWMRPRNRYRPFRPPVSLDDLRGHQFPSGYLLITNPAGDDVVRALPLRELGLAPRRHLEAQASPTCIIPWCASVATAQQKMHEEGTEVGTIVNELGETIGIITLPDILDAIFAISPERGERLLNREPIRQIRPDVWQVEGVTNLRRLARHFECELPESHHATLAGVVEETLERLPVLGDECAWGPLRIRVVEPAEPNSLLLEVTLEVAQEANE